MTRTLQVAALLAALPHLLHRAQTVAAEFDAAVENEDLAELVVDDPASVAATLERISKDFAEIAAGIRAVHAVTLEGSDVGCAPPAAVRTAPEVLQRAEASVHHQAFNLDCPVGVADTIAQSAEVLAARNREVQRRASSADGTGIVGEDTH